MKKLFLDLIFPAQCLFCGKNTESEKFSLICGGCFSEIPRNSAVFCPGCFARRPQTTNCPRCASRLDLKLLGAVSSYQEEKVRILIQKFKYNSLKNLAYPLAELTAGYLKLAAPQWCANKSLTLLPVPLHPRKENRRGFNQSAEIAKIVARNFGWTLETSALRRIRNNPPQVELPDFRAREANVKGLFRIQKPEIVRNKKIVLIDDVFTSGATMFECARVLKEAGAERIYGLVIAKG